MLAPLCETSAGALHPVSQIGTITKKAQALFFTDATAAIGTLPCYMDDWVADCLLASLHESLPIPPPGVTALDLSKRARENKLDPATGHTAATLRQAPHPPLHTPETTSEQNQLAQLCTNLYYLSPKAFLFRHCQALAPMVQTRFITMGIDLVARSPAPCVTAIRLPFGIEPQRLLDTAAQQGGCFFRHS